MDQQHTNVSLFRALGEEDFLQELMNHTSQFCSPYDSAQWYCYLLVALYALALPVGIVGNAAALLNYACSRRPCSSSAVLLLNLALCDSAWMLTLPFVLFLSSRRPRPGLGLGAFCRLKRVSFDVNVYGSILFLTLISFDRYVGAAHPVGSLRWWGAGRAKRCSALAWAGLLLWSVPDLFLAFREGRPGPAESCTDHMRGPLGLVKTVSAVRTVLGFAVPFVLILVFYGLTVRALRRGPPQGGGGRGKRRRAAKPLLLISAAVAVFAVSFLPYHVTVATLVAMRASGRVTAENSESLYAAYELFEALCSVSSALDPLLYILASERFQKGCRTFRRRPPTPGPLCCLGGHRVTPEGDVAP